MKKTVVFGGFFLTFICVVLAAIGKKFLDFDSDGIAMSIMGVIAFGAVTFCYAAFADD